jgi:integrase
MSQEVQSTAGGEGKPKLLDQVRQQCRVRHLALSTEDQYVSWIRRFILFHNKRHPLEMGKAEVSAFLTHLAVEGHVAASTQNQALSALLFLYEREFGWLDDVVRAKKPKHLPVVFTVDEMPQPKIVARPLEGPADGPCAGPSRRPGDRG